MHHSLASWALRRAAHPTTHARTSALSVDTREPRPQLAQTQGAPTSQGSFPPLRRRPAAPHVFRGGGDHC